MQVHLLSVKANHVIHICTLLPAPWPTCSYRLSQLTSKPAFMVKGIGQRAVKFKNWISFFFFFYFSLRKAKSVTYLFPGHHHLFCVLNLLSNYLETHYILHPKQSVQLIDQEMTWKGRLSSLYVIHPYSRGPQP